MATKKWVTNLSFPQHPISSEISLSERSSHKAHILL